MRHIIAPAGAASEIARLVTDINAALTDLSGRAGVSSYTVAALPTRDIQPGTLAYVSDETGGAVIAFFDGTVWRRCTDRAVCA